MVDICYGYLSELKNVKMIKREVPFLSRCIDIVVLDNEDNIITIEFKVHKWRQAIEQASNHKLGADKAYICLPKRKVTNTLLNALTDAGLGLFLFDEENEIKMIEAISVESKNSIEAFRNLLYNNVMKV
jgi:hypothetical protein